MQALDVRASEYIMVAKGASGGTDYPRYGLRRAEMADATEASYAD